MVPSHTPGQTSGQGEDKDKEQGQSLIGSCSNGSGMTPVLHRKPSQRGTQDTDHCEGQEAKYKLNRVHGRLGHL